MIDPLFAAYLSYALLFAATPGQTTALVVRNTLAGGRTAGFGTAAGAALANATYAAATALGLATVLGRWPGALNGLRVAGACYLGGLGAVGMWRAMRHGARHTTPQPDRADQTALVRRSAFRQGLTLNLLNPSIAAFYLSAVPLFLPPKPSAFRLVAMGAAHVTIAFGCHATWAMVLHGARRALHVPGRQRWLEIGTGIALIGLAARILMQAR